MHNCEQLEHLVNRQMVNREIPQGSCEVCLPRQCGADRPFATLYIHLYTQSCASTLEVEERRSEYGERRIVAIGVADRLHLTVVYTDRQSARGQLTRRIISARRSSRHERKIYQKANP